ncbi:metal transport-related, protein [Nitritalea halalkaliphila LW7]|uniref:Metal transport-related, protein n=2 Tax=Nitritalea TaxID=1187887 RepID=I5C9L5_9BACT|nr:metal transport-related, protein [Nitritalea halalkaliphila LW7]
MSAWRQNIQENKMKVNTKIIAGFLVVFILGAGFGMLLGGGSEEVAEEEGDAGMWISPMHPHIRQNEPGQCPICGMDLVPMSQFKGMDNDDPFLLTMSEDAAALARVETEQVVRGAAAARLTLTGKIQANEQEIRRYAANYGARVEHLAVNFTGQQVRKGDLLAKLYAPELLSAQQELRQAAARKAQQPELYRAVREKLRLWKLSGDQIDALESGEELEDVLAIYADVSGIVTVRNVTEGDFITRGTVLFEIVDLSTVWAMLAVYEQDLPAVREGTEVELELSGAPGDA